MDALLATGARMTVMPLLTGGDAASRRDQHDVLHEASPDDTTDSSVSAYSVKAAVSALNDTLQLLDLRLRFSFDQESRVLTVTLVDQVSGEVIRQFTPFELLTAVKAKGLDKGSLLDAAA